MSEKPLFIPLAAQWFDAFATGSKTREYRLIGARWNEKTCRIGRAATLSRGYGKQARLYGRVASFTALNLADLPADAAAAMRAIYAFIPDGNAIAEIGFTTLGPAKFFWDWDAEEYPQAVQDCLSALREYIPRRNFDRSYRKSARNALEQARYLGITAVGALPRAPRVTTAVRPARPPALGEPQLSLWENAR